MKSNNAKVTSSRISNETPKTHPLVRQVWMGYRDVRLGLGFPNFYDKMESHAQLNYERGRQHAAEAKRYFPRLPQWDETTSYEAWSRLVLSKNWEDAIAIVQYINKGAIHEPKSVQETQTTEGEGRTS